MDLRARAELLNSYRAFRRGIITLPYLERDLARDLGRLGRYIVNHGDSVLQEGFIEVAILAIETTKDAVESTLDAVESLMDYVATSGRIMGTEMHAKYVRDNIRDEEAKHLILDTLRLHGGVTGFLEISHSLLAKKQFSYSRAVRLAKQRSVASWREAQNLLTDHYKGELETLEDYWKRLLEEEKKAAGGYPYFSQVAYELCLRYPEIAKKLGVQCPKDPDAMWPIILIAVACAILCEGG